MSKGKYSPTLTREMANRSYEVFCYNAIGEIPINDWPTNHYETITHFGNYDSEGFDSYGYSAFDKDGAYLGIGLGVDRLGYTEDDYLGMSDEEFEEIMY